MLSLFRKSPLHTLFFSFLAICVLLGFRNPFYQMKASPPPFCKTNFPEPSTVVILANKGLFDLLSKKAQCIMVLLMHYAANFAII